LNFASAAAASSAANIPSIRHFKLGAEDIVEEAVKSKVGEVEELKEMREIAERAKDEPFPKEVKLWSVDDVSRWLDTLRLGQYKRAFRDASVDGEFLLELREEDMMQVLGMEHRLHVRKVILARAKLTPLSPLEEAKKSTVLKEEKANQDRENAAKGIVLDIDVVFSQARNNRLKRLEESLNAGFHVDKEDEKGNTLLLVASQNCNQKMVEMLLRRQANINHQNVNGNTALHFAMAYDVEGNLGEFLIENGADDTIENGDGLTAYDGLGDTG